MTMFPRLDVGSSDGGIRDAVDGLVQRVYVRSEESTGSRRCWVLATNWCTGSAEATIGPTRGTLVPLPPRARHPPTSIAAPGNQVRLLQPFGIRLAGRCSQCHAGYFNRTHLGG
jgi:hypothetical protein